MERKLRLVHRKEANLSHAALAFLKGVREYAEQTGRRLLLSSRACGLDGRLLTSGVRGSPNRYNESMYVRCACQTGCDESPEDVEVGHTNEEDDVDVRSAGWRALTAHAQESRQDVSLSATGNIPPQVNGQGSQLNARHGPGRAGQLPLYADAAQCAGSELQLLAVRQPSDGDTAQSITTIHTRQQEVSFGYVYSRNYRNYNPFAEVGVGAIMFSPIRDFETAVAGCKAADLAWRLLRRRRGV